MIYEPNRPPKNKPISANEVKEDLANAINHGLNDQETADYLRTIGYSDKNLVTIIREYIEKENINEMS